MHKLDQNNKKTVNKRVSQKRKQIYRKLHRWLGLSLILFIVFMAFSGILINHSDDFQLDEDYVKANWLLDWYGIKSDFDSKTFSVASAYITKLGDSVYFNHKKLVKTDSELIGAVKLGQVIVVAMPVKLLLLRPDGALVESISAYQGLPTPIIKIAVVEQSKLLLQTASGNFYFDVNSLQSSPALSASLGWSNSTVLPEHLKLKLMSLQRQSSLSWERLLLDLHSGRFLGSWGVYLVDFFAILFVLLSLTGFLLWFLKRKT